jgi:hypothetical protein
MVQQVEPHNDSPEQQIIRLYRWRMRVYRAACVLLIIWGLITFAVVLFLPGEKAINLRIFQAIYIAILLGWAAVFYAVLRCPACDALNPQKKGACKTCSARLK